MSVSEVPLTAAVRGPSSSPLAPIDALLVVSFGGPEAPEHVVPFLQQVTRGRDIPEERLRLVGQHYFDRGGVSPINDHCRSLIAALAPALADSGVELPIYWGNRNWDPWLVDAVSKMRDDGITNALAFVTSAYSSYSSCRQYRENIAAAQATVGDGAPQIEKLRVFYNHPGFVVPIADAVAASLATVYNTHANPHVLFTAHSIPTSMADTSAYEQQLCNVMDLVAELVPNMPPHQLVWQSRSGPPHMPWLEPDVCDAIDSLSNHDSVVIAPIGFISDHMEVIQDLDTDARRAADRRGFGFVRASTVGTDPRFISAIVELVHERISSIKPRALGNRGLDPTQCVGACCPAPTRARPAAQ